MRSIILASTISIYVFCVAAQQTCYTNFPSPCSEYVVPQTTADVRPMISGQPMPGCSTLLRNSLYNLLHIMNSNGLGGFSVQNDLSNVASGLETLANSTVRNAFLNLYEKVQAPDASAESAENGRSIATGFVGLVQDATLEAQSTFAGLTQLGACVVAAGGATGNLGKAICKCLSPRESTYQERAKCEAIDLSEYIAACSQIFECETHKASVARTFALPNDDERYLSLPMVSMTATPSQTSRTIVAKEGPTYYLAWKAIEFTHSWTDAVHCKRDTPPQGILPGWESAAGVIFIETSQELTSLSIPIATVATKPSAAYPGTLDVLIALRGTITEFEWRMDFEFAQTSLARIPGNVHRGFAFTAVAIYQKIQNIFQQGSNIGLVTVTGHSAGAAFSVFLSILIAQDLGTSTTDGLRVRALLFSPPRVGSQATMDSLASTVNVRTFQAENDINQELPCNSMPACPPSIAKIPSGELGTRLSYANYPGLYVIPAVELGAEWALPLRNLDIVAWHMCTYKCFTTKYFSPKDPDNQCGRTEGTRCPFAILELPETMARGVAT